MIERIIFYLKLNKNKIFNNDLYRLFFEYFEITWFSPKLGKNKDTKNLKFPFALWSYYDKLKKKINKDNFYDISDFEKYISFSNNAFELLNAYIKTYIPLNQNVSAKVFVQVSKIYSIKIILKDIKMNL